MARKIPAKLILEYRAMGLSRNAIAKTKGIGKSSVSDVFHRADDLELTHADIENLSEVDVYRRLFPERHQSEVLYDAPDYNEIHMEHVGVTLKLLWEEYQNHCHQKGTISMGYTKFCAGYQDHTLQFKLTNHLKHKPGITTEVDWSGSKMQVIDQTTGEIIPVSLFVATLPYSQYTYVEPTFDQKSNTWLKCHVNMYEFFGGSTVRLVCDNLKTGVIHNPKEGDIILNSQYKALGDHYMTAIMPAPVRKPKGKASVESAVGKLATAVIASLRHQHFYSLSELKLAIKDKLTQYNDRAFQKREGSRTEIFTQEEVQYLRALPKLPYEISEWVYGRKVNLDCHILYKNNYYSCPYQYVKQTVNLKVSESMIEIYHHEERIATHTKCADYQKYAWATQAEHLPDQFHRPEWDDKRLIQWAQSIGPYTREVIQRVFDSVKLKEQGYRSCLSILQLTKKYSKAELESACGIALEKVRSPRYKQLKTILSSGVLDHGEHFTNQQDSQPALGYIRGADYYGGKQNDE